MAQDTEYAVKLVSSATKEPSADELKRRQDLLLSKLKSITPDQLAGFIGKSASDASGGPKMMWEKTVWEK